MQMQSFYLRNADSKSDIRLRIACSQNVSSFLTRVRQQQINDHLQIQNYSLTKIVCKMLIFY